MLQAVRPIIESTTLSCGITSGSKDITSISLFDDALIKVGSKVFGVGIPMNAVVAIVIDPSTVRMSVPATATNASASLQFAYFTSAAYAAGDCLGFPFQMNMRKIGQIYAIDGDKVITAIKGYIFNDVIAPTLDNAAFAPSDADAFKIIGYFSLTNNVALANNTLIYSAITDMAIHLDHAKPSYCQLVVVGTPTFTAVNSLQVNFLGE